MPVTDRRTLRFGNFSLDLARCSLQQGEREIPLRPKAFDVLRHLAENPGRLVSKDELMKTVWAGVVVTDNDWTDCHAAKAGGYDPVERLTKLRSVFFDGNESLGQRKMRVERQSENAEYSKFRENVRWRYGDVMFITLHMPGENNNLGRTPAADSEYRERNTANLAWLKDAFAAAKKEASRAVAIFTQANPLFEHRFPAMRAKLFRTAPPPVKPSGYADFLSALESEVLDFGKPVVLVHGDTHFFRVDKPLFRSEEAGPANFGRQIENFTRMEVFGFPESHWVRVVVDVNDPQVFTFKQQVVDKNRFKRP